MIRDEKQLAALLGSVRRFMDETAIPNEERVERENAIPEDIVDRMRSLGFFGWSIPEEYGGAELTTEELCLANMEISQCAVAYRARAGTNTGIGSEAIIQDGTDAQKRLYLPRLATGEITGCLAVTEPNAGSDLLGGLATSAVEDGDHYVLNGTKRYITNAPIADLFTVLTRTDPSNRGGSGTTCFLIERGTPGLSVGPEHKKMGQEGSPVSEVYFKDCRVPKSSVLGGRPGKGFGAVMRSLNKQRINLASLCTGPAIRLLDEGLRHARTRQQSGQAIGEFQNTRFRLARMATEIEAARQLMYFVCDEIDQKRRCDKEAAMVKFFASEMAERVTSEALQVFGGAGYTTLHAVERYWRDARLTKIFEGTSEIQQRIISDHLLGKPKAA